MVNYVFILFRRILRSLFLNAIRANIEVGNQRGRQGFDPLTVLVVKSTEEISIKISDLGGGIERGRKVFRYLDPQTGHSELKLPAVRKLVRYLGGEVSLASMTGLGTDVVIHIKSQPHKTLEHFP